MTKPLKLLKNVLWIVIAAVSLMLLITAISECITQYNIIQNSITIYVGRYNQCKINESVKKYWDNDCIESERIINSSVYPFTETIKVILSNVLQGGGLLLIISYVLQIVGINNSLYITLGIIVFLYYFYQRQRSNHGNNFIVVDPGNFMNAGYNNYRTQLPYSNEFHGCVTSKSFTDNGYKKQL